MTRLLSMKKDAAIRIKEIDKSVEKLGAERAEILKTFNNLGIE